MARARKCDVCGCLYEPYDGAKTFKKARANAIVFIDRDDNNSHFVRATIDLCEKCMSRILDDLGLEEK